MRKGTLLQEYNLGVILLVVTILVIIIFFTATAKQTDKSIEESECHKQVVAHVQALKLSNSEYATEIKCPIIFETLKEKKEKEIKQALAERMRKCWYNWQEGNANLFTGKGVYCHPCYILNFEHDNVEIKDFTKFLIETTVPNKDYKYIQYLTGTTNNEDFKAEKLSQNPKIRSSTSDFNTKTSKVILFYYIKDSDKIKEFWGTAKSTFEGAAIGTVGGAVLGGVAGSVFGPAGIVVGVKIGATVGALAGAFIAGTFADDYPLWLSYVLLREYNEDKLKELGCETAPAKQN